MTGTDLLPVLSRGGPIDLFGIDAAALGGVDLVQTDLHTELARRRAYVHPFRWTSLGLTLIEAMMLGLPVVCLATTEVADVVPRPTASCRTGSRTWWPRSPLRQRRGRTRGTGCLARQWATQRFGIARFLRDWDEVLGRAIAGPISA